ncbi:hypothetical protein M0802_000478 [Mischocyttarus mexicanus]|nr:hypothetical protein M0802_000478 [Mischocyttarus mexicanus]
MVRELDVYNNDNGDDNDDDDDNDEEEEEKEQNKRIREFRQLMFMINKISYITKAQSNAMGGIRKLKLLWWKLNLGKGGSDEGGFKGKMGVGVAVGGRIQRANEVEKEKDSVDERVDEEKGGFHIGKRSKMKGKEDAGLLPDKITTTLKDGFTLTKKVQ